MDLCRDSVGRGLASMAPPDRPTPRHAIAATMAFTSKEKEDAVSYGNGERVVVDRSIMSVPQPHGQVRVLVVCWSKLLIKTTG